MSPTSEAAKRAAVKYSQKNIRQYILKINRKFEPELIAWIDSHDNVQQYLKGVIRADYEANAPHQKEPAPEPG